MMVNEKIMPQSIQWIIIQKFIDAQNEIGSFHFYYYSFAIINAEHKGMKAYTPQG